MFLSLFNDFKSKMNFLYEAFCLYPSVILSNKIYYKSKLSSLIKNYLTKDTWNISTILSLYRAFELDKTFEIPVEGLEKHAARLKLISKVKHKPKELIVLEQQLKSFFADIKSDVTQWFENFFETYSLKDVLPFIDDKVFVPFYSNDMFVVREGKENPYINEISKMILSEPDYMILGQSIEDYFPFVELSKDGYEKDCDFSKLPFIKVKLFDFPYLALLTHTQLAYTRNNLRREMMLFEEALDLMRKMVRNMSLCEDLYKGIENLAPMFSELYGNVQKAIDEELYVQQAKQKNPGVSIFLCLGICSYRQIIEYYQRMEIIEPYVAEAILKIIERKTNPDFCDIFFNIDIYKQGVRTMIPVI